MSQISLSAAHKTGIEIECVIPDTGYGCLEHIAEALHNAGLKAKVAAWSPRPVAQTWWKVTTDGSLGSSHPIPSGHRGVEVVSPPLKGRAMAKQLKVVCEVLRQLGAKVTLDCGTHVHHDARDFDMPTWQSLLKLAARHEQTIDTFVAPSRRGNRNRWARQHTVGSLADFFSRIDACRTVDDVYRLHAGDRYIKVNPTSFRKHGTVEFRQHQGTVCYEKMMGWLALTQSIVLAARANVSVLPVNADSPYTALFAEANVADEVQDYMLNRAITLAA